jgi:hypothetical protein
MNNYQIEGKIEKIFPVSEISYFKIQQIELKTQSAFSNTNGSARFEYPIFQFGQKLFDRIGYLNEGDDVVILFTICSTKGTIFNNLRGYQINKIINPK